MADTAEPPQPLEATQNIEKASPYEDLPMIDDNLLISLEEVAPQKITLHQPALQKPYKKKVSVQKPAPPRDFDISETNFSLTRVLIPILLGGCLIWLTRGYIQYEAMSSYKPPPKPEMEVTTTIDTWDIETKLRKSLSEDIIPLVPTASFEDILQVELARFRLQSINIEAKVTKWTGRKEDRPQKAKVSLTIDGTGEIDHDIAAVSLILGKYMEQYFMDIDELELCLDTEENVLLCASLDAEVAREFYLQRVSYPRFFEKIIL